MRAKDAITFLWKLIVCALAFVAGMMLGGTIAAMLRIPAPVLPPEIDASATGVIMLVTSPLLVLALYFVNRGLAGGRTTRAAMLFLLTWIAYSVNNVIEAAIFTSYGAASWYTIVSFLPAILFSAAAVAWLFPGHDDDRTLRTMLQQHFRQRTTGQWAWRLLLAAVIFAPIYYLFGLLVVPFVGDHYEQGAFGLAAPSLATLLVVLLGRSLLFTISCLPVVVAWQGSKRNLWLSLGFALFVFVGLLYMLAAIWLPASMRMIHSLEILADSLVYAGALVWLLSSKAINWNDSSP